MGSIEKHPHEIFIEWCNFKGKAHYPLIASVIEPHMHVADQLQWTPVADLNNL